ncbi:MAG: nucleoside triphosphate hydrolase [Sphingomonadaceae bacterium]|jgi:thymidylate kinase
MPELAPLIAIVGADGSGKTTVSAAVMGFVRRYGQAETAHLGLRSGDLGRAIQRLPLVGAVLDRKIHSRASRARDKADTIPGPFTALVIFAFSQFRLLRFRRMMHLRRAGQIIVTDRYPQTDVPGFFDGPGLSAARAKGWFTRRLARLELRQYQWMASFRPSLVIRLNVDLETAFARKPDHRYESLRQKVEATRRLRFGGAPIVDFDSSTPLEVLVEEVQLAIAAGFDALGIDPIERTSI